MDTRDAAHLIRDHHKKIRGLFTQFFASDARAHETKEDVARQLFNELEIHDALEREVFYPAVRRGSNEEERGYLSNGESLHQEIRDMMGHIRTMPPDAEDFESLMDDLRQSFELHVDLEEREIVPWTEMYMSEQLEVIGQRMWDRRAEIEALPRYRNVMPEGVQMPHGGEQKRRRVA